MTRNFDRDLTIMVAGSGNVTMKHLEDTLGDWMFPNPDAEREVRVILPLFSQMGAGIRNLIQLGMNWEFKFTVIQAKDAPMTRELSALPEECFERRDTEREALEYGLEILSTYHKNNNETAFIMAHNPNSTYEQGDKSLSDFEVIGYAKTLDWLQTLNLCEGLVDSFDGYESAEATAERERLQKEFDDKQREIEAAKPAAKKAVTPRKRVAKKAVAPVVTETLAEPEKPLQEPSEAKSAHEAWNGVNRGFADQTKKGPNPFRAPLPTGNELSATVTLPDIQEDIREAHAKIEKTHVISVSKIDLAQLSTDIKELTTAFGNIMDTFTRILKDN